VVTRERDIPETVAAPRAPGLLSRLWQWRRGLSPLLVTGAAVVYFAGFSLFRQNWTSLLIFLPVLIVAAIIGRLRSFALTWIPLAVFLDAFARLRALADNTGIPIHHTAVLEIERHLFFGTVPTVWLQSHYTIPKHFHWYDYAATLMHWSHFVAPILILFILWLRFPALFRRYALTFVTLTMIVLDIYFLCPAAPPWLAAKEGYLPHVARPMVDVAIQINRNLFGNVYATIGASNDVAAMPSLHASYPFLMFVMFWPVSRKLGLLGLAYFFAMSLSLVYLGEHYVTDILAAMVCVLLARWIAFAVDRRLPVLPERRPLRDAPAEPARVEEPAPAPVP
jgi:hypothetical protein